MGFFTLKHKRIARKMSRADLMDAYYDSEMALNNAAYDGNEKELKKAMKEHGKYEYAMLYQNTPKYLKKMRKGK